MTTVSRNRFLTAMEDTLPWALPILLLFSRALADITIVIIAFAFLYKSYSEKNWHWASQGWFRLCLLFFTYLLLFNTPFSINHFDSFSNSIAFMRWPIFAAALAYWLFDDPQRQQRFLIALMCVSAFIVFDTWWQYLFGADLFGIISPAENRLTGPFRNLVPGTLMLRVLFILLFAGLILQSLQKPRINTLYAFTILIIGLSFIFITGERMAFILFTMGTLITITGLYLHYPSYKRHILSGIFAVSASIVAIMLINPSATDRIIDSSIYKIMHFPDSDYATVFKTAVISWQQSPILGSGLDTYKQNCQQLGELAQFNLSSDNAYRCSHPHNLYLEIAAETGIIGLILFSSMVIALFYAALAPLLKYKQWYRAAIALAILLVSFWPITGGISPLSNWVAALIWLGVGWVLAISRPIQTA